MAQATKVTAKEIRSVLTEIVANGYHHIQCINNEISALKIDDPEKASDEDKSKLRALTLTLTLVNDLIHPAHKISKKMLKEVESTFIDYCINAQKIAIKSKLVEECFCQSCTEDKKVSQDA